MIPPVGLVDALVVGGGVCAALGAVRGHMKGGLDNDDLKALGEVLDCRGVVHRQPTISPGPSRVIRPNHVRSMWGRPRLLRAAYTRLRVRILMR